MLTGIRFLPVGFRWCIEHQRALHQAHGGGPGLERQAGPDAIWLGYILFIVIWVYHLEWWRHDARPFRARLRLRSARWGCWCPSGHAGRWATSGAEMSN